MKSYYCNNIDKYNSNNTLSSREINQPVTISQKWRKDKALINSISIKDQLKVIEYY